MRIPLLKLSGGQGLRFYGLWTNGGKESVPPGGLRRARGIHAINTQTVRSRWGSTLVTALAAHSLYRFNGVRFQGATTILYRNGISILTGLSGDRLTFVRMPPSLEIVPEITGVSDYLFVAGGGVAKKVDLSGNVSKWGIDAPPDGFAATITAQLSTTIDLFEDHTTWTAVSSTLTDESAIIQEGTNSMKMVVVKSTLGTAKKAIALDLTKFSDGSDSSNQDYIAVWVRVDHPSLIETLELAFDIDDATFNKNFYVVTIPVTDIAALKLVGIADVAKKKGKSDKKFVDDAVSGALTPQDAAEINTKVGVNTILTAKDTWIHLKIPKITFTKAGTSANTWANVAAVKLLVQTNSRGSVAVYWDKMELLGGAGLVGDYNYQVTFLNSVTQSRSNPNPTALTVTQVDRQTVNLTGLPVSADTQVDSREIWRTVGNGALLFRVGTIADNTTTVFSDNVVEFAGMNDLPGIPLMENVELPTTNIPPEDTFADVVGPYQGRLWWCRDSTLGDKGHLFYSPVGLPESVEGFVQVTNDDDPSQKSVIWNGALWTFTNGHLFQIAGDAPPYVALPVFGAPGTTAPFTVIPTAFGIFYQAQDGVRLFDGIRSQLVGFVQVGALFRGEASENLTAFEGVVAAFNNNEYYISDGTQTLAYNREQDTWRDLGIGVTAFFYEVDTGQFIAAFNSNVQILEAESVLTDNNTAVSFQIETPSVYINRSQKAIAQIAYLDINPNGQTITPALVLDDVVVNLPTLNNATRAVYEYPIEKEVRKIGMRLTGTLSAMIEIFGIDVDVHEGAAQ